MNFTEFQQQVKAAALAGSTQQVQELFTDEIVSHISPEPTSFEMRNMIKDLAMGCAEMSFFLQQTSTQLQKMAVGW